MASQERGPPNGRREARCEQGTQQPRVNNLECRDGFIHPTVLHSQTPARSEERRERCDRVSADSSIRHWHRRNGCRGFKGPVPPPLWMSASCVATVKSARRPCQAIYSEPWRRLMRPSVVTETVPVAWMSSASRSTSSVPAAASMITSAISSVPYPSPPPAR